MAREMSFGARWIYMEPIVQSDLDGTRSGIPRSDAAHNTYNMQFDIDKLSTTLLIYNTIPKSQPNGQTTGCILYFPDNGIVLHLSKIIWRSYNRITHK